MMNWKKIAFVFFTFFMVSSLAASNGAAADFSIGNYALRSKSRVSRTDYLYTFSADATNSGDAASEVSAALTSSSEHTVVVDGELSFGDVGAGATVTSVDTFSIRQDRRYAFDESALTWNFSSAAENIWEVSNAAGQTDVAPGWDLSVTSDIEDGEAYYYVKNDYAAAVISTLTAENNGAGTFQKGFVADFVNRDANYETLDWTQFQIAEEMHSGWNYPAYELVLDDISIEGEGIVAAGYWASDSDLKTTVTYTMLEDAPILKISVLIENEGSDDFSGYLTYQLDPDGSGNQYAYAPGLGWSAGYNTTGWTDRWVYDGPKTSSTLPAHGIAWITSSPTALNVQGYIVNPWFNASVEAGGSKTIILYHITDLPADSGNTYDSIDEWASRIFELDSEISEMVSLSGIITDADTGEAVSGASVMAKNTEAEVVDTTTTDENGEYSLLIPADVYTLTVSSLGYGLTSKSISMEAGGEAYTMDITMEAVTAWAGTNKVLSGSLVEATGDDIVMENSMLAMAVAVSFEDSQLSPSTAGKPVDLAVSGLDDIIDWINLPYISGEQPTGSEAWQVVTVENDAVVVEEVTEDHATVSVTGAYSENTDITVKTTYNITSDTPYILAETVITNDTGSSQTLWVGDVIDVDESGQASYVPGTGEITAGYSSQSTYSPSEPWIAQYGGSTEQSVGLIYLGDFVDFNAYGNCCWIMSQQEITIEDGDSFTMRRYVVAVSTEDYSDKGEAVADVYADLVGVTAGVTLSDTAIASQATVTVTLTITNNSEAAISGITADLYLDSRMETADSQSVIIDQIVAGDTRTVTWQLTGVSGGNSLVRVTVENSELLSATKSAYVFVSGPGWYAGDNHNHSTYSDGSGTIAQNYESARSKGLAFVTSTDHNSISQADEVYDNSTDTFLGLVGEEVTSNSASSGGFWGHALAYNIDGLIDWLGTAQEAIDDTVDSNDGSGFFYIAHPYYPGLEWKSWDVYGYTGIEVWNGFYDATHSVNSQAFDKWDELNVDGMHLYGISNSDAHNVNKIGDPMIKAYLEEFTREEIIDALSIGRYYGTNGPELSFTVNDAVMGSDIEVSGGGSVTIALGANHTAAISSVTILKNGETLVSWTPEDVLNFSETYTDTPENGDFYRLVVQTTDGGYAFSNPVWVYTAD